MFVLEFLDTNMDIIRLKRLIDMSAYRIEYREKNTPGDCYKYAANARELLIILTELNAAWIDFETITVYSNL